MKEGTEMFVKTIRILTKQYVELDVITPQVEAIVAESGVKNGGSLKG